MLLKYPNESLRNKGYTRDNRVFPVPSNGCFNSILKKIAKQCGIKKRLTYHVTKHTFGFFKLSHREFRLNHYFDDFTNKAFRKCVECNLLPVCSPCPKTIYENGNICPPLVYNIEQRILLDYLLKRSNLKDVL